MDDPDPPSAFADGFFNPFGAGHSMDAIACWGLLVTWVAYEVRTKASNTGAPRPSWASSRVAAGFASNRLLQH